MASCCVKDKTKKYMQHMYGNIQSMFYCWANPVVHLLLLKSSIGKPSTKLGSKLPLKVQKINGPFSQCFRQVLRSRNSMKHVNNRAELCTSNNRTLI